MKTAAPKINPAAIDLLTRYFNTHKKGLPEWMKNSREAYLRTGVGDRDKRVVLINFKDAKTERDSALECIDFAGVSGDNIEAKYIEWGKPDAANLGVDKGEGEGGQGNGGKAYLKEMFEKGYFISIFDGKLSVVSFVDDKKHVLEFVPSKAEGKDIAGECPAIPNIRKYAADWLKAFGLPADHNITIVRGIGPKVAIDPDFLLQAIQQFPQARNTIESCRVKFYVNGAIRRELEIKRPPLHSSFPAPVKIAIPPVLISRNGKVPTTKGAFGPGELELCISAQPLTGQALTSWNRIDFYGQSEVGNIGHRKCEELDLALQQFGRYLYGRCRLPLLVDPKDNYEMQGRGNLNEGPLSEALYEFIAEQANKLLEQLESHVAGAQKHKKQKNLEKLHDRLVNWIESKLTSINSLQGAGANSGKPTRNPPTKKVHEPAVKLGIHRPSAVICKGVSYELRAVAYDAKSLPVPPGKVNWRSQAPAIVSVHPDSGLITGVSSGIATITVSDSAGKLVSQPCIVQVHEAQEIVILGKTPVKVGPNRRIKLETNVKTIDGKFVKDSIVAWHTSDGNVATVGPDGWVHGGEIGEADVTASAGQIESNPMEVLVEKGLAGKAKGGGKGTPTILLSGSDGCPFDKAPVYLSPTDPVVHQRPGKGDYEYNVFWINLQHPLAQAIFSKGVNSLVWRTYHFQRIVDIYVKLMCRSTFAEDESLSVDTVLDEIADVTSKVYADAKDEQLGVLCDDELSF